MNKILKILCGVACAFVFCFLAIGYAAVQDELLVTGSVSVMPQDKVFAVYGERFDSNGTSLGMALNFYNRSVPELNGTIELIGADGMKYGTQNATAIYEDLAASSWAGYAGTVESVAVVDAGVQPESTASWFSGFSQCIKFDLVNLDTSALTDMNAMFSGCSTVTDLNLSNFNTQNVSHMSQMFKDCSSLDRILVSEAFTVTSASASAEVFSGCIALKGGAGTTVNNNVGTYYARIDGGSTAPGYFTYYKYAVVFEPNYGYGHGFDPNYENNDVVFNLMLSDDGEFTLPADSPFHPNAKVFLGWATTKDAATAEYGAGATFKSDGTEPHCDVLYAVWKWGTIEIGDSRVILDDAYNAGVRNFVITGGEWTSTLGKSESITVHIKDGTFSMKQFYSYVNLEMIIDGGRFVKDTGMWITGINGTSIVINRGYFEANSVDFASVSGSCVIYGGTFEDAPVPGDTSNYFSKIADGYTAVQNSDGTWEVVLDPNAALVNEEETTICTCETKCSELTEACEVCKTDIVLCKGTEVTETTEPESPTGDSPSNGEQGEQPAEDTETTPSSDVSDGDVVETEETQTPDGQNASESQETSEPVISSTEPVILPSEDEEDGEEQESSDDQQGQE